MSWHPFFIVGESKGGKTATQKLNNPNNKCRRKKVKIKMSICHFGVGTSERRNVATSRRRRKTIFSSHYGDSNDD
jgi:hypothetical protein